MFIQALGMLMASFTHLFWISQNGFMSDKYNAPVFSKFFWDSLTFIDPLASLLLIIKPKTGLYLTLIILIIDIIHNNIFYMKDLYFSEIRLNEWINNYWMILGQIIFGAFVILTFKENIQEIKDKI